MNRCDNCINPAPANGGYAPWQGLATDGTNCPTQCNAGFGANGTQCAQCVPGKYSPGGLIPAVACVSCTGLAGNAYWLQPDVFNRSWNGCPSDCIAGYYRDTKTGNCVGCTNGRTYSDTVRTSDRQAPNVCRNCSVCVQGSYYSSVICNASRDTVCTPCKTSCNTGYYLTQCNSTRDSMCVPCRSTCATGQFMTNLCTGTTYQDTVQCFNCTPPASCVSGLYMPPGQCPGNTLANSVCVVCRSLSCPFGTYQRPCSMYNDTSCVPYTQCVPGRTTLRNRGLANDGVCLNCTNCSAYGLETVSSCSQYLDTLCNGTACSGASPCANLVDRNFFCSLDAIGGAQANRTTRGVCGMCPDGYSSDGLYCYECPGGKTCSRDGAVQCQGVVQLGLEPGCFGEYAQPTGALCPYSTDPARVVTRSTFLRPNGNCAPYFSCAPGYFKHFGSTGLVTCDTCNNNAKPTYYAWFSSGLSFNDPFSCLYECAASPSWPDGGCTGVDLTRYVPRNLAGFYDDGSGAMKACPGGWTSQPGLATAATDCVQCYAPERTLGDQCHDWTCPFGQLQRGGRCFDPAECPLSMVGYTKVLGACVSTGLPWQPAGYQKTQAAAGATPDVVVTRRDSGAVSGDTVSATVQTASNQTLVFYSTPYGQSRRHWLEVNASVRVQLPGRVCSAAAIVCQARQYVVVAFCNASFLSFVDLALASPSPRVLIGSNAPGYLEGFKRDALFERELYVASEAGGGSLFVADTMNCALRVVTIPNLPGEFVVRSYLVYGYTAVVCSTVPTAILYPGRLFPVLGQTYFLFSATGGLYQLDAGTRSVVQIVASAKAPAWMPDLSLLRSVTLAANTSMLTLGFDSTAAVLTPVLQRCDVGSTSVTGGACTKPCSTSENYVDPASGECRPCFTRDCLPGEEKVLCTPSSPQTCKACLALEPEQGRYPRIYNLPDSCALSNTLYTAPCPVGFYLSATQVRGSLICARCPVFSSTSSDGSTSIDQCRCYEGAMKSTGGTCVVKQLYPLPTLSNCPFATYPRGAFERCSSCRLDPFPFCNLGRYPLSNGSCEACQVPEKAVPARAGRAVNAPRSCGFACLPGYFPLSNTSYLTQCQPCTNAPNVSGSGAEFFPITNGQQDSPSGCTWGCRFPFKILNGQCVPCTLVNPKDSTLPCRRPGWGINSSAGAGSAGSLGAIQYRMIQFNTSGYIVFSTNTTVDLLLVGGGGAGGQAGYGGAADYGGGAGGGGGAGQVLLKYNVTLSANVIYPVVVGAGGAWVNWLPVGGSASSVAGVTAIPGGTGGAGVNSKGAAGSAGASGGGAGSRGKEWLVAGGTALAGNAGGADTSEHEGTVGAGGGGAGCVGGSMLLLSTDPYQGGQGGCGLVLWANASSTFFFPNESPALGGGGGGGYGLVGSAPGLGKDGGGTGGGQAALSDPSQGVGNGQDAMPNTGAGGGGATRVFVPLASTPALGGAGGSGLVVVRFVDEACVCAN